MRFLLGFLIMVTFFSCEERGDKKSIAIASTIDRQEFKKILNVKPKGKVQVINFWATWCAPCVEELPSFEEINLSYGDSVEVILISLDDPDLIEKKVNPFLKDQNITSKVVVLDDPYSSEWIPLVDPHWDGAIPVTLIKNETKNRFYNQTFTSDELENEIQTFL
ncbi:MAG: TlpA disulfide reductase family protein [Nonlabens sp.]